MLRCYSTPSSSGYCSRAQTLAIYAAYHLAVQLLDFWHRLLGADQRWRSIIGISRYDNRTDDLEDDAHRQYESRENVDCSYRIEKQSSGHGITQDEAVVLEKKHSRQDRKSVV